MEWNSAIATATGTTESPSPRDEPLPLLFSGIPFLLFLRDYAMACPPIQLVVHRLDSIYIENDQQLVLVVMFSFR